MRNRLAIFVMMLFVFALVAGALHAVTVTDDKAKSTTTVNKEDCCKKGAADCKDNVVCKDEAKCKDKQAGGCPSHQKKAPCAPKEGSCPDSCPAKSACEKK
jgi:hypothetical protein